MVCTDFYFYDLSCDFLQYRVLFLPRITITGRSLLLVGYEL